MIYFDNNATTQIAPEVFEAMKPYLTEFYGNPSSSYVFGRENRKALEDSRENIADLIGAKNTDEIVFTSCGTESDNWAVLSTLKANPEKKHIITTRVEHEAIRKLCEQLETEGYGVTWLDVDEEGAINPDQLKRALHRDTVLVSVMLANNETGILFPVEEMARVVKSNSSAVFHVDGVNAVGKVPIDLKNTEIDLFSLSGHKFHGPKGIGALYVKRGIELPSLQIGGGQERGRRAGTEAVHQIIGIGEAARIAKDLSKMEKVRVLRDKLENGILKKIPGACLNGTSDPAKRLPNTSNMSFPDIPGEAILAKLSDLDVCVSTGSACNAETREASPVLKALNVPYQTAMGAIRFSLGRYNTEEEVDTVLEALPKLIDKLYQTNSG